MLLWANPARKFGLVRFKIEIGSDARKCDIQFNITYSIFRAIFTYISRRATYGGEFLSVIGVIDRSFHTIFFDSRVVA